MALFMVVWSLMTPQPGYLADVGLAAESSRTEVQWCGNCELGYYLFKVENGQEVLKRCQMASEEVIEFELEFELD